LTKNGLVVIDFNKRTFSTAICDFSQVRASDPMPPAFATPAASLAEPTPPIGASKTGYCRFKNVIFRELPLSRRRGFRVLNQISVVRDTFFGWKVAVDFAPSPIGDQADQDTLATVTTMRRQSLRYQCVPQFRVDAFGTGSHV